MHAAAAATHLISAPPSPRAAAPQHARMRSHMAGPLPQRCLLATEALHTLPPPPPLCRVPVRNVRAGGRSWRLAASPAAAFWICSARPHWPVQVDAHAHRPPPPPPPRPTRRTAGPLAVRKRRAGFASSSSPLPLRWIARRRVRRRIYRARNQLQISRPEIADRSASASQPASRQSPRRHGRRERRRRARRRGTALLHVVLRARSGAATRTKFRRTDRKSPELSRRARTPSVLRPCSAPCCRQLSRSRDSAAPPCCHGKPAGVHSGWPDRPRRRSPAEAASETGGYVRGQRRRRRSGCARVLTCAEARCRCTCVHE